MIRRSSIHLLHFVLILPIFSFSEVISVVIPDVEVRIPIKFHPPVLFSSTFLPPGWSRSTLGTDARDGKSAS